MSQLCECSHLCLWIVKFVDSHVLYIVFVLDLIIFYLMAHISTPPTTKHTYTCLYPCNLDLQKVWERFAIRGHYNFRTHSNTRLLKILKLGIGLIFHAKHFCLFNP